MQHVGDDKWSIGGGGTGAETVQYLRYECQQIENIEVERELSNVLRIIVVTLANCFGYIYNQDGTKTMVSSKGQARRTMVCLC